MKKVKIIIPILIILFLVISVTTLALFTWTSPNTSLTLEVGEMTDIIFKEGNDIIASNIGPVLNYEDGETTEFVIINNAESDQKLKFYLDIEEISDSLKEESFKYVLEISTDGINYTKYKDGNFKDATTGQLVISDGETLPSGSTYYRFIIYIDGNMENPISMMNNSLKATFNVTIPLTVADLVEQMKTNVNSNTPDFSQSSTTDEGIFMSQDDYGTSYYFRGAVTNNYVKFAGYYWRIIRSNGDGTIRMIYDGTSAHANGEESVDRRIGSSIYNTTYGDNAYVGYMMGIDNQCASGSCSGNINTTSYEQATTNTYNSTVKTYIDSWYETNIEEAGYSDYLADVVYCNDRSLNTGMGYGTIITNYYAYQRITNESNPVLTCDQKNDRFTVNDTSIGNGKLTYPISLITIDEMIMGGGNYNINNDKYYLYIGHTYFTLSPFQFNHNVAYLFLVNANGDIVYASSGDIYGVRPVISLKSTVELSGSGTMEDPYVVQ